MKTKQAQVCVNFRFFYFSAAKNYVNFQRISLKQSVSTKWKMPMQLLRFCSSVNKENRISLIHVADPN
ncbi:hypothetical protein Syun_004434 [Stephania yunnanensis]|uniref:Uncharacterized protein n=1 Tax=Stephania yunnanensis TaxID=152371 RepID=A0AAP0L4J0_9MAGN